MSGKFDCKWATWETPASNIMAGIRASGRRGTERSALMMAGSPYRRQPSLPRVAWLERDHPCPDIEERIREAQAQHHE